MLRVLDGCEEQRVIRTVLNLMPPRFVLPVVRPGELRHAKWSECDLENAIWMT